MPIYALDGIAPEIDPDAFVADTAVVIGRVRLAAGSGVWFGAVLRGDNEWIEIGRGSNVQDGAIIHTDIGFPCTVGANCTIGHAAILHGCTIGQGALVGMAATILNGARIGEHCLVGAGALVAEGKAFEPRSLIVGMPAKAIRTLDDQAVARIRLNADGYVANAARYRGRLTRIG